MPTLLTKRAVFFSLPLENPAPFSCRFNPRRLFAGSGAVYHKGSCFIVDRYVISMDEVDAVKKGYTPCSRCI
jgi:hypothetical protein